MKRTVQQMEAACEHRICVAINRLIQARSATEKTQALQWVKAWEARRFSNVYEEMAPRAQAVAGTTALQFPTQQNCNPVAALQPAHYQATVVQQH